MDLNFWNIVWIVIGGALIGVIARLLLKGRQDIPWWSVIGAGIVGMFVGDWLADLLGVGETWGYDWIRHIMQVIVAMVAVFLLALVFGKMRRARSAVPPVPPAPPSTPMGQ